MRPCRTCKRELPLTSFWRQPAKKDGLQSECKDCMRVRTTKYGRANRDRLRPKNNEVVRKRRVRNPKSQLLAFCKYRAKRTGHDFSITMDDLDFPEACPVLGIPLSFGVGFGEGHGLEHRDRRYSIDRIDNSKGYIPGNVVVISYRANRLKSDATVAEMKAIARFYERLEAEQAGEATMPPMQPHSEKQAGQVLIGDAHAGGLGVVLPQSGLRLQGRD